MVGHRVVHHVDPFLINDPLTNGTTVGTPDRRPLPSGSGMAVRSVSPSGIDYDVPTGCIDCTLEFDATNFGGQEGFPFAKDLKWVSMGDPNAFGGFGLVPRSPLEDAPGAASRLPQRHGNHLAERRHRCQWRRPRRSPDQADRHANQLFQLECLSFQARLGHCSDTRSRSTASRCCRTGGITGSRWRPFAIELGCIPRAESFIGIIYRNVTLKKDD